MDEQELEFSLEDIIKEFSDQPSTEEQEESEDQALEQESDEVPEEKPVQPTVSMGDTIRMDVAQFSKGVVRDAQPIEEEEETPASQPTQEAEPFSEGWEPEYEQPIAEYVPPRPIVFQPRSRLRELKRKLVAGPEKLYYAMMEKGFGKLQAAIFFSVLVVVISAIATAMYAFGFVQENRMRLMVFGQFLAMLLSALLGSYQLLEGVSDLFRKQFSLNTMLVFSFLLCCVDGILCLKQLRVPCCAAFSLQVTMSLWSAYQKRNIQMGQLDTMRKATHLDGITAVPEYYEDSAGFVRGEAQVEDFMDTYDQPCDLEKAQGVYAIIALCISVATGIVAGVLHSVSMGIQVAAVTTLAALPASMFVSLSRPMAVLERRLHALGGVLCGWQGVEGLNQKAVFPVSHEDLCPVGTVKLNGVKFYGNRESDEVIAYCAALCNADGGALAPLFTHLLDSRNGIHYEVEQFHPYGNGGIGGEVNQEPVLVGTLPFLRDMGVHVPGEIRVSHAVGISVDGELEGLFAIAYDKEKSALFGLGTLCGYRNLNPIVTSDDFMLTEDFIRSKFNVNTKKVLLPDYELRAQLRQKKAEEGQPMLALSTGDGLAPFAYCVTGARALKSACKAGNLVHMIGGGLGMAMMLVLAILGAQYLLTPANMFLYELVWMIPGLLITNWTRPL